MYRRDFLKAAGGFAATAAAKPPVNLLFVMSDQFRFDALSCAGNRILRTPNLDRLAKEGAIFRNAMSACPVCVPARTTILTGKTCASTHVVGNASARDLEHDPGPSFDNLLNDRGYKSQYYGKWHAPYKMARTYDNKVCPVGARVAGVMEEKQHYLAYLDKHVPVRRQPGQFLDAGSNRYYTPAILDARYGLHGREDEKVKQAEEYGWLHIPKEHARAAFTVDEALHALEEMKAGPFSLTCSIGPPHPPMVNVEPYWGMYPAGEMPLPKNFADDMTWSPYRGRASGMDLYQKPENIRAMTSIYYGLVAEVDDNIGRLLDRLEAMGLAQNTLVIFTADHGEMLGSHGMNSKGVFYEESAHVPLLMRLPGAIRPGTAVENPVTHADLFPTILDYLGAPERACDGRSLRTLIEGRAGYPDFCVSEWNPASPNLMVRTRDWKLMIANRAEAKTLDALFNLKDDPYEMRNLVGAPDDRVRYRKQAGEMKERLLAWMERVHAPGIEAVKQRL